MIEWKKLRRLFPVLLVLVMLLTTIFAMNWGTMAETASSSQPGDEAIAAATQAPGSSQRQKVKRPQSQKKVQSNRTHVSKDITEGVLPLSAEITYATGTSVEVGDTFDVTVTGGIGTPSIAPVPFLSVGPWTDIGFGMKATVTLLSYPVVTPFPLLVSRGAESLPMPLMLNCSKKLVSVEWTDFGDVTYDGSEHHPSATIPLVGGGNATLDLSYTQGTPPVSVASPTQPGTYTATASLPPALTNDYVLGTNTTKDFTIKEHVSLTVTPIAASKTYGDADPALDFSVEVVPGTVMTNADAKADLVSHGYALTRAAGEDVGTYLITASPSNPSLSDYTITFSATPVNFTINPLSITVAPDAASKAYGDADPALDFNVTVASGHAMTDAAAKGELTGYALVRAAGENIGDYLITASPSNPSFPNYTITFSATPVNFTINTLSITVTPNAASKAYGDADPALDFSVTVASGHAKTDAAAKGELTGYSLVRAAGESAGDYLITASPSNPSFPNYAISFSATPVNFTINPLSITVTPNAASKAYGDADPALDFSVTVAPGHAKTDAAAKGELTGYALVRAAGESAGDYLITASPSNPSFPNYTITFSATPVNFTINPLSITVTPIAASKTYGDADPALGFNVTVAPGHVKTNDAAKAELVGPDSINPLYKLQRAVGENVGAYAITASPSNPSFPNYTVSFSATPVNFTINPLSITVTPIETSKPYGALDPALDFSVTVVPGHVMSTPEKNPTVKGELTGYALVRATGENVGDYAITASPSNPAFPNYAITFNSTVVNFTVTNVTDLYMDSLNSPEDIDTRTHQLTLKMTAVQVPNVVVNVTLTVDTSSGLHNMVTPAQPYFTLTSPFEVRVASTDVALNQQNYALNGTAWKGYLPFNAQVKLTATDMNGTALVNPNWNAAGYQLKTAVKHAPGSIGIAIDTAHLYQMVSGTPAIKIGGSLNVTGDSGEAVNLSYGSDGTAGDNVLTGGSWPIEKVALPSSGETHKVITATAKYVDTENLSADRSISYPFVNDTIALTPDTSTVKFENRGDALTFSLPEPPDKDTPVVTLTIDNDPYTASLVGTATDTKADYTCDVTAWKGTPTLYKDSSVIRLSYTDRAGNQSTAVTAHPTKSTTSAPITMKLIPNKENKFNAKNGKSLTIKGTGQQYETLQIMVGGKPYTVEVDGSGSYALNASDAWKVSGTVTWTEDQWKAVTP